MNDYLPLHTYEGYPVGTVYQRHAFEQDTAWEISEHEERWLAYGSLIDMPAIADAPDPDAIASTEYDALGVAEATLRTADPALLDRLDFDPESSGTGIEAPTREDLERALNLLRLPPA